MKIIVSYIGLKKYGVFLGDAITMALALYELYLAYMPCRITILLHPQGEFNYIFRYLANFLLKARIKYVDTNRYEDRVKLQDEIANTLTYDGEKYDLYYELYPRLEGGPRQHFLCGYEKGLGRTGTIEYYYYGQRGTKDLHYKIQSIFHLMSPVDIINKPFDIFYAPFEKCQGNSLFKLEFHDMLIMELVNRGYKVTINSPPEKYPAFNQSCRISYELVPKLFYEIKQHKLAISGNTGIGWAALIVGTPLLAFETRYQNLCDYNFHKHANSSLYAYLEEPNLELSLFLIDWFFEKMKERVLTPFDLSVE